MTVQTFMKIVWTVFEKFEIFVKRSGEKTKKRHDWISSRKFFPTPKNSLSEIQLILHACPTQFRVMQPQIITLSKRRLRVPWIS